MKIIVNYDLINSIKDVNEPMGPLKIIRNEKTRWAKFNLPIYTAVDIAFNSIEKVPLLLALQFGLLISANMIIYIPLEIDDYKKRAEMNLNSLVTKLRDLNVETDYDKLLKSELDGKTYNIRLNESKLPELVETKYILVPSYSYQGELKTTNLQQEHVVGSKSYVLSIGSMYRQKQLAYANI